LKTLDPGVRRDYGIEFVQSAQHSDRTASAQSSRACFQIRRDGLPRNQARFFDPLVGAGCDLAARRMLSAAHKTFRRARPADADLPGNACCEHQHPLKGQSPLGMGL
jgi:hypothetical protein